jgi:single-strand DNA-binding protein
MSVNKVILVGNVGKDPETRYLDETTAITKFPLATSETYKNKAGERVSTTEWHNIVLWRGLAQVAEKYVKKGSQIYIEGRIKNRSYDDAEGNRKYITEIVGDQLQLLGKRPDDGTQPSTGGQAAQSPQAQVTQAPQAQPQQTTQAQAQEAPQAQPPQATQAPAQEAKPEKEAPFSSDDNGADDLPF